MGSISRTDRCDRFRQKLEEKIVAKAPFQVGDQLEVTQVSVGMADGEDVSKLYITVKNLRTEDEDSLTFDECLFDPETTDDENVERLLANLHFFICADRQEAIKMLKSARLIDPKYEEKS